MAKKGKTMSDEEKLINYAIKNGVNYIVGSHPLFGDFENYILHHVDQKGIVDKFNKTYSNAIAKSKSRDDALKTAYKTIEKYIASGNLLDDQAKKVILTEGLKEKTGGLRKVFRTEILGEKYLNNTINTFKGLDDLMQSGDYAEKMPEVAQAVAKLKDAGFHYAATRILKEGGIIDEKKEQNMLRVVYKNVKEEPKKVVSALEQKIAASIIGAVGMLIMLFNANMTGAVIGENSTVGAGIVGIGMILFALLLYSRPLKKALKSKKH
jgi:hypothetical protein